MNEEELIQETRKLIGQWDNVRIVGLGWAGDSRRGFQFNPTDARTGGGGFSPPPPPPTNTGACCPESGDCFISTQSVCEEGGGTYQGDDTTCDPDPCPPKGACCVGIDCTIETGDDCTGIGGTYQGDGTTCDPNPCTTGNCCLDGSCTDLDAVACSDAGGTFFPNGDCSPDTCIEGLCTTCLTPGCHLVDGLESYTVVQFVDGFCYYCICAQDPDCPPETLTCELCSCICTDAPGIGWALC